MNIEDANKKAIAAWRGHVPEEVMQSDLRELAMEAFRLAGYRAKDMEAYGGGGSEAFCNGCDATGTDASLHDTDCFVAKQEARINGLGQPKP